MMDVVLHNYYIKGEWLWVNVGRVIKKYVEEGGISLTLLLHGPGVCILT